MGNFTVTDSISLTKLTGIHASGIYFIFSDVIETLVIKVFVVKVYIF